MPKQPNPKLRFYSSRFRICSLVLAVGFLAACASVAGFLGAWSWFLDLFAHFRVQYFLTLAIVALISLLERRKRDAAIFGALALLNLAVLVPLYFGWPAAPVTTGKPLRMVLANVNSDSGNPARVMAFLRQAQPDLVVLEEINNRWVAELRPFLSDYPYQRLDSREDNFGILLCSRHPFVQARIVYPSAAFVPTVVAEVNTPQGTLTVVATHPLPPIGAQYAALRDGQLAALPAVVHKATSPVVLLGDLNTTPWGAHFQPLVRASGLRDSAQGRGVQTTWTWGLFDPFFRLPIDHCLLSPSIGLVDRQVGPDIGSDHRPLIIDLVLPPPSK